MWIKMYTKYLNGSQTTVITVLRAALIMTQLWEGLVNPMKLFIKEKKKTQVYVEDLTIINEFN